MWPQVEPLSWGEWLVSVGIGALSIPISLAVRLLGRATCDRGNRGAAGCCRPARARLFGTGREEYIGMTELAAAQTAAPEQAPDSNRHAV